MLPFDLPPPVPVHAPAPERLTPSWLAEAPRISAEEQAFHLAVSVFQQRLAKLPPKHRAEIHKLHAEVTAWADKQRAAGRRADKLSTFVGRVMGYADAHLKNIEKADPKLKQLKDEHKQFQNLFLAGNDVIESYLAWVRTDYQQPKPIPKNT